MSRPFTESTLELLAISRSQPFSYNHDTELFQFGDESVAVGDIPTWGTPHQMGEDITTDEVRAFIETTPFVYSFVRPIGLPRSVEFFDNGWTAEIEQETNEVMADVLVANSDRYDADDRKKLLAQRSFASLRRTQPGDVILHVAGNCACLGPDFTAHFCFPDEGIMEYTFHNIDQHEQKLSLMAGLGHVARRANEWLALQDRTTRQ